jgi:hypothetical protein
MGLRAVATGAPHRGYLPPGPIFGIPVTEPLIVDEDSDARSSPISSDGRMDQQQHQKRESGSETSSEIWRGWSKAVSVRAAAGTSCVSSGITAKPPERSLSLN